MRRFWTWNFTLLLTVGLIAGLADVSSAGKGGKGGGGGGGGGGEDPPTETPVTYDVTWLPTPTGSASYAADVNDSGKVVGYTIDGNLVWTAVVWPSSGGMVDLNVELSDLLNEGERLTSAREINNAGRITGHGADGQGNKRTFIYDEQLVPALQWLPAADGSPLVADTRYVRDLAENGTVLIEFRTIAGGEELKEVVVWNPNTGDVTYVPQVSSVLGLGGSVTGLNDSGVIVGGEGFGNAFYYQLGADAPVWLDGLGKDSYASDISNGGIIAGQIGTNSMKPARWVGGVPNLLTDQTGNGIEVNEAGQILGSFGTKSKGKTINRPFIYDPIDGFWDIDGLVDANDSDVVDWFLAEDTYVEGIAEGVTQPYGPIAGWAWFGTTGQAFVLTPIP